MVLTSVFIIPCFVLCSPLTLRSRSSIEISSSLKKAPNQNHKQVPYPSFCRVLVSDMGWLALLAAEYPISGVNRCHQPERWQSECLNSYEEHFETGRGAAVVVSLTLVIKYCGPHHSLLSHCTFTPVLNGHFLSKVLDRSGQDDMWYVAVHLIFSLLITVVEGMTVHYHVTWKQLCWKTQIFFR